jgi:uncharacterized membrane protein YqjE
MADGHNQGKSGSASGGLRASLQGLLATLLDILQTRLALFSVEVEEEKLRLLKTMAWGAAAVMLAALGLGFAGVLIAVVFWEAHREWVLGLLTLAFALGATGAFCLARAQVRASSGWLQATLDELESDRQALLATVTAAQAAAQASAPPQPPSGQTP